MANKIVSSSSAVIIGGGPAGLMAAEVLGGAGMRVDLYDAMPSVGRKFLLAGRGGLNLTHAEPLENFAAHYGIRHSFMESLLKTFTPDDLRSWVHGLGIETFVGSSGRVFPSKMKSAPLLRTWLHRLRTTGVNFHMRHLWQGWRADGVLRFSTPNGEQFVTADATVLALGGGSWPQLGSDGSWAPILAAHDIEIKKLHPSNCGFDVRWSEHFSARFSGQPVKSITAIFITSAGVRTSRQGEFMITAYGVEGELVYALSAPLRDEITAQGKAIVQLDLVPGRTQQQLSHSLSQARGKNSFASHLRKRTGLHGVKAGLLREIVDHETLHDPARLAAALKSLPLTLIAPRPLAEAISTAGGIALEALDDRLMIKNLPGVFCAGEMLDWEAPTGGYLLTACIATGHAAGHGVLEWLESRAT